MKKRGSHRCKRIHSVGCLSVILIIALLFLNVTPSNSSPLAGLDNNKVSGFTAIIPTFRRSVSAKAVIQNILTCKSLARIIVVWSDQDNKPYDWLAEMDAKTVVVKRMPHDRLTNRFVPFSEILTDAVYSQDDDKMYRCESIEYMFELWRRNQDHLVGFAPRKVSDHGSYWSSAAYRPPFIKNTVFVTLGGFLHRRFYEKYFEPELKELRELVDSRLTGEDFLMSLVHAKETGLPPLWVNTQTHLPPAQKPDNPLDKRSGSQRPRTFKELIERYEYNLVETAHCYDAKYLDDDIYEPVNCSDVHFMGH